MVNLFVMHIPGLCLTKFDYVAPFLSFSERNEFFLSFFNKNPIMNTERHAYNFGRHFLQSSLAHCLLMELNAF